MAGLKSVQVNLIFGASKKQLKLRRCYLCDCLQPFVIIKMFLTTLVFIFSAVAAQTFPSLDVPADTTKYNFNQDEISPIYSV